GHGLKPDDRVGRALAFVHTSRDFTCGAPLVADRAAHRGRETEDPPKRAYHQANARRFGPHAVMYIAVRRIRIRLSELSRAAVERGLNLVVRLCWEVGHRRNTVHLPSGREIRRRSTIGAIRIAG